MNTVLLSLLIGFTCILETVSYRLPKLHYGHSKKFLGEGYGGAYHDFNPGNNKINERRTQPNNTAKLNILSDQITNFTIALYKQAEPIDDEGGNKIISPFSVIAALMFTMLGTRGNTESQLMSSLQLTGVQTDNIHQEYKRLQDYLNTALNENVILTIANRLFPRLGINLNQQYELDAKRYYDSEVEALDFAGNSEGSRLRINEWASNKTNNLIQNILPRGSVNGASILFLVNAIYFKGDWVLQFDKKNTEKKDFFVTATKTEKVDMMNIDTGKLQSGINEQLDCKVLELPYKGNKISMLLVLPNTIDGIVALENRITSETLKSLYSSLKQQETIISIPKFEMLTSFSLIKPLQNLGITDLFDSSVANFNGMFQNPPRNLHVNSVIQKAFVRVDEEGTEAAAVTSIGIGITSVQIPKQPMTFIADHPFLFLIREKETGTILFMGRFTKP